MKRLAIAIALFATSATAHEWYDTYCCSGNDCERVKASVVRSVAGGYLVTVNPGDHSLAKTRVERFIPFDHSDLRAGLDGDWHVCLHPANTIRCVYQPGAGF